MLRPLHSSSAVVNECLAETLSRHNQDDARGATHSTRRLSGTPRRTRTCLPLKHAIIAAAYVRAVGLNPVRKRLSISFRAIAHSPHLALSTDIIHERERRGRRGRRRGGGVMRQLRKKGACGKETESFPKLREPSVGDYAAKMTSRWRGSTPQAGRGGASEDALHRVPEALPVSGDDFSVPRKVLDLTRE